MQKKNSGSAARAWQGLSYPTEILVLNELWLFGTSLFDTNFLIYQMKCLIMKEQSYMMQFKLWINCETVVIKPKLNENFRKITTPFFAW